MKGTNTLEPLPCPFCNEIEDFDVQLGSRDKEGTPVAIVCGNCGATGPWEYYNEIPPDESRMFVYALVGWNKRKTNF